MPLQSSGQTTPRGLLRAKISGIRDYYPQKVVTNHDLAQKVDTTHEWILERTGIMERRISEPHETPAYMGAEAAKVLLKDLSVDPKTIDLILLATITGDYPFPASACAVQREIGAVNAFAYDLSAACSGYLYALETARAFIESGLRKRILIIAAEKMSAILNYKDRSTCILFGDAGSATLVEPTDKNEGILDSILKTDGNGIESLYSSHGGSRIPLTVETLAQGLHYARQDGKAVFKRAVVDMADVSFEILQKNKLTGSDIACFVPHQANMRIMEAAANRIGLPLEKMAVNIDRYGNTTAATIPTALRHAEQIGQFKKGDLVLLASFGAGFTWGSMLIRM